VFMQHMLAKPQALTIVAGVPVGQGGGVAAMGWPTFSLSTSCCCEHCNHAYGCEHIGQLNARSKCILHSRVWE
jgi:hypothetical protein